MPYSNSFELGSRSRFATAASQFASRLAPLIYIVSAFAFLSDLLGTNTLAYGIIYTPLIATAVFHRQRNGLWILTGSACAMVTAGAIIPAVATDLPDLIGNRLLSVIAIVATAAFVHHARDVQDRLAELTRRAEAAERIKTQVLTDLSEEIRTPLHTLLGVLALTMATTPPEQRAALGRVRTDGRQLLATIDNLLDLSQVQDRILQQQTVDLAMIARDAAATVGAAARERQITVALTDEAEAGETKAIGDSWAIRRILDNFLVNAVRLTPPGGAVSVSVRRSDHTVTASVSDTGKGLPAEVTREFHEGAPATDGSALPTTGGAGLALSSRLARTMNGRVVARNQPDSGAMVSLSLPAA
jgi:signal transduction histidine kinase